MKGLCFTKDEVLNGEPSPFQGCWVVILEQSSALLISTLVFYLLCHGTTIRLFCWHFKNAFTYLIYSNGRATHTERSPTCCFTPQLFATAPIWPGWSQEWGTEPRSPLWATGTELLEPLSLPSEVCTSRRKLPLGVGLGLISRHSDKQCVYSKWHLNHYTQCPSLISLWIYWQSGAT